jgi:hypothetical protein
MENIQDLEKRIVDLQNHYQFTLLGSKEFSQLKEIKNNLKKLYHQLHIEKMQTGSAHR